MSIEVVARQAIDNLALPAEVRAELEGFVRAAAEVFGPGLLSVAIHGSAVRGSLVLGSGDIDLLVVAERLSVRQLKAMAPAVLRSRRRFGFKPLFLTRQDLLCSTDVFPLKFLSMKSAYVILEGVDLLGDLAISREHIRLACEQSAKSMLLRLRQLYMSESVTRSGVVRVLLRHMDPLAELCRNIFELEGRAAPSDPCDLAELIGLPAEILHRIGKLPAEELPDSTATDQLFEQFVELVAGIAAWTDRWGGHEQKIDGSVTRAEHSGDGLLQ